jgi:hypothetical protein
MSNIHIIIIIISYSLPYFITLFIGPAGILHDEIILTVTSGFSMWRSAAPVTQSRDETRAFAMAHRAQASPPPPLSLLLSLFFVFEIRTDVRPIARHAERSRDGDVGRGRGRACIVSAGRLHLPGQNAATSTSARLQLSQCCRTFASRRSFSIARLHSKSPRRHTTAHSPSQACSRTPAAARRTSSHISDITICCRKDDWPQKKTE